MTPRPDAIRSAWPLEEGASARPHPLGLTAWILQDGIADGRPREPDRGLASIMRWRAVSFLVVPPADRRPLVRLNGVPVPGGLAPLSHGDHLSLGSGPNRRRYWLSTEGPCLADIVESAALDALTLEEIPAGSAAVHCGCGATYALESWSSRRRCVLCDYAEDGVFRQLPPGWCTPSTSFAEMVR